MLLRKTIALVAILLGCITAQGQVDQVIYNDAWANGWSASAWNGGYNDKYNYNPVHTGTYSIDISLSRYGSFLLNHARFDTTLFSNITFWAFAPVPIGSCAMRASVNGVLGQSVTLLFPVGTWQQFTVPLASLGVAGSTNVDGFVISEPGPVSAYFYLDDIRLTAAAPPAQANVTVVATQAVQTVDARMFGMNASVSDGDFASTNTSSLLAELDTQVLRFPGGSAADDYHWESNTSGTNTAALPTSFDSFAHVATNARAKVFVTVNYGSGTATEASNWVRYANVTKGYGFKDWEIGNENYGTWEKDTNIFPNDPFTYATRASEFIAAMKAADPSIQVGVVALTGEDSFSNGYTNHPATNPRTGQKHNGWTPVMLSTLKNLGVTPDFVTYHKYAQSPGSEDDASLLQSAGSWAGDAANLRQQLTDYLGTAATNVEMVCTANNSVSSNPGKQTTSIVNGLFLCDSVAQALQTEFRALVWRDLRSGQESTNNNSTNLYGWRQYGDFGIVSGVTNRYPAFFAAKLMKNFARGGDVILRTTSDYPLLTGYASRHTNGAASVLLINKSSVNALTANVRFLGRDNDTNAILYSYGLAQDEAARTQVGSLDLTQTNLAAGATNFVISVPAYTAVVVWLPPAAPRLTIAAATNSTVSFQLRGEPGSKYVIECASNPAPGAWVPLTTNVVVTSSTNWSEPMIGTKQFYRTRSTE